MSLSRDDIGKFLETAEVKTKSVPVPELSGSVVVQEMSGTLRNQFEAAAIQVQGGADSKAFDKVIMRLVAECTLDDEGHRLFDDRAIRLLFENHSSVVFRLRDEIVRLSSFSNADFEGLAESFGDDPSEPSTSD